MLTITVGQLTRYVRALLEEDKKLADLYVKGEISNFTQARSGHLYFSLKDRDSAVRCVMFRSDAELLRFMPQDGMLVLLRARVGFYERDGMFQLYAADMQPDGAGALAVAFEQLKARLAAEGLFHERHKKPLPAYPSRIGVITSETGAALHDILNVLSRRYPLCTVVLSPAQVQGAGAPESLVKALRTLDGCGMCDVIIIGRGGGSAEDLACFNDEKLARAVFACNTPIISAVGHEVDYTICDFVADLRAPTPSAAAELAAPSIDELRQSLARRRALLHAAARAAMETNAQAVDWMRRRLEQNSPLHQVLRQKERLDFYRKSMYNKACMLMQRQRMELSSKAALLDSLSPLAVLGRGYALVKKGAAYIHSAAQLAAGDEITLRLKDGYADAAVRAVTLEETDG